VQREARKLHPLPAPQLATQEIVEDYTEYLVRFVQTLIDDTVPWACRSLRATAWWNPQINQAVHLERQQKRQWLRTRSEEDWTLLRTLNNSKKKLIQEAKRATFRTKVYEASQSLDGVWKLANWARTQGGKTPELPMIPPLHTSTGIATTRAEKEEALRNRFFPESEADLSDIQDTTFADHTFTNSLSLPQAASEEEIAQAIASQKSKGAPGPDGVSTRFLKLMGQPLVKALTSLTTACWHAEYFPTRFRLATTVCLKKPNKGDYGSPGAWRPIALLSTIGKVIEKAMANRLRALAEEHSLLPDTQMGGRRQRSTYSALELLTEQVHTIWNSGKHVASLLSLDISGAFDTVSPLRLLDVLRKKGIPAWATRWIGSFLHERKTTLVFNGSESESYRILGGAPQGSPLSPILFLLYNSELVELCSGPRTSAIGFMDDINILTYSKSTERNCLELETVHSRCLAWAKRFGMKFAPQKYELIHFTRRRTAFNLAATIRLGETIQHPKQEVRILGVWIDPKLKWAAHIRQVLGKAPSYQRAIDTTAASTWGACFRAARQVYCSVFRAGITYGAPIWHTPSSNGKAKGLAHKLIGVQNKAIRRVAGTYKATRTERVETECLVPPINLYLDNVAARYRDKAKQLPVNQTIRSACLRISARLRRRRRTEPQKTPMQTLDDWAEEWRNRTTGLPQVPYERRIKALERGMWREWQHGVGSAGRREYEGTPLSLDPTALTRHSNLTKAESSILIQLRVGVLGLNSTLSRLRVPDRPAACRCGNGPETVAHFLLWCRLYDDHRQLLRERTGGRPLAIRDLLGGHKHSKTVARWAINSGRFEQFSLARTLL
jgi:hypothetical protein